MSKELNTTSTLIQVAPVESSILVTTEANLKVTESDTDDVIKMSNNNNNIDQLLQEDNVCDSSNESFSSAIEKELEETVTSEPNIVVTEPQFIERNADDNNNRNSNIDDDGEGERESGITQNKKVATKKKGPRKYYKKKTKKNDKKAKEHEKVKENDRFDGISSETLKLPKNNKASKIDDNGNVASKKAVPKKREVSKQPTLQFRKKGNYKNNKIDRANDTQQINVSGQPDRKQYRFNSNISDHGNKVFNQSQGQLPGQRQQRYGQSQGQRHSSYQQYSPPHHFAISPRNFSGPRYPIKKLPYYNGWGYFTPLDSNKAFYGENPFQKNNKRRQEGYKKVEKGVTDGQMENEIDFSAIKQQIEVLADEEANVVCERDEKDYTEEVSKLD